MKNDPNPFQLHANTSITLHQTHHPPQPAFKHRQMAVRLYLKMITKVNCSFKNKNSERKYQPKNQNPLSYKSQKIKNASFNAQCFKLLIRATLKVNTHPL